MMTRQELIAYCKTYTDVYEDYPFDETWTVMRHISNKKCFAFLYEKDGAVHINLKCEPMRADFFRSIYPSVKPAYHMNKVHWNTVIVDGTLPFCEIADMIAHSYELTRPRIKKK